MSVLHPESSERMQIGAVAKKFGISTRTVDRWLKNDDLKFPRPIRINDRRYWASGDLDRWAAQRESA